MKIEGYLFIPYQGQVRFRYDSTTDLVFQKSDGAYDKDLGVLDRPPTCMELVSRVKSVQDAQKKILWAFEWVVPQFHKSEVGTLMKMELGDGPTQLPKDKNNPVKITLTVLLVDK